MVLLKNIC